VVKPTNASIRFIERWDERKEFRHDLVRSGHAYGGIGIAQRWCRLK
jgi:hypothetical protein